MGVNSDPGTHNFLLDNRSGLYRMIRDQWFGGDESRFATNELSVESELKSSEALTVPLPLLNNDFQTLARSLAESLPRTVPRPEDAEELKLWRTARRMELAGIVRPVKGNVTTEEVGRSFVGDLNIVHWKLRVGKDWMLPVVEISRGTPVKSALVISDEGRKSAADHVERLVQEGFRVFAFDPFGFGELVIQERGYLWSLMISTVGERPLGVQAGQIMSVAQWVRDRTTPTELLLVTDGPRTGVIGLVAASLDRELLPVVEDRHNDGIQTECHSSRCSATCCSRAFESTE